MNKEARDGGADHINKLIKIRANRHVDFERGTHHTMNDFPICRVLGEKVISCRTARMKKAEKGIL